MSGIKSKRGRAATFIATAFGAAIFASSAIADERPAKEKFELGEPFFGENALMEKELEFGYNLEGFNKKRTIGFSTKYILLRTTDGDVPLAVRPIKLTRTQEMHS